MELNRYYKLVESEFSVRKIRRSILAHASDADDLMDGEIELDECYFGGC